MKTEPVGIIDMKKVHRTGWRRIDCAGWDTTLIHLDNHEYVDSIRIEGGVVIVEMHDGSRHIVQAGNYVPPPPKPTPSYMSHRCRGKHVDA